MKCTFCGSEINEGEKFCMSCGTSVASMVAASQAPVIPEITMPQAPVVDATPVPTPVETPSQDALDSQGAYFADQNTVSYTQADANVYSQAASPVVNAYSQPVVTPVANAYGQPVVTPVANAYSQPAVSPVVNAYGQPAMQSAPVYEQTNQSVYSQPSASDFGTNQYATPMAPYANNVGNANAYTQDAYNNTSSEPQINVEAEALGKSSLTMGIVALALCGAPVAPIILGALGLSKSNTCFHTYGYIPGKGKVGRHLSRAGMITGIICSAYYAIIFLGLIIEMLD